MTVSLKTLISKVRHSILRFGLNLLLKHPLSALTVFVYYHSLYICCMVPAAWPTIALSPSRYVFLVGAMNTLDRCAKHRYSLVWF